MLMNRLMHRLLLLSISSVFWGTAVAKPLNFEITNGVNPVYLNQSAAVFAKPGGISITPDGAYLLIADPHEGEIKIFDTGRLKLLSQFGKGELGKPEDVSFDRKGQLLVTDTTNNRIMVYKFEGVFRDGDPNIEHVATLSIGLSSPNGVSAGAKERIYITNSGDNSVVLIKNGDVVKHVRAAGTGNIPLLRPTDVHSVSDQHVFVSDSGNNRVLVFDPDLNFIQELSTADYGFDNPGRIASDDTGTILISDTGHSIVKIIGLDFKPIGIIARTSPLFGNLNGPQGVETIGRYLWVSDTGNKRVVLFKRN